MSTRFSIIVWLVILIVSCTKHQNTNATDEISGAYAREYSFKVVNQETGTEIGMRTIRDTIFIGPAEGEYEVSNKKWRLNDYDKEGWQNMEHSDDRPFPSHKASFESTNNTLISQTAESLHLEFGKGQLYKEMQRSIYKKTE